MDALPCRTRTTVGFLAWLALTILVIAGPATLAQGQVRQPSGAFPAAQPGAEVRPSQISQALAAKSFYVEPGYAGMTEDDTAALVRQAVSATTPIYLALVTDETSKAAGGLAKLLSQVSAGVDLPGTYIVADSTAFRTTSTMFPVADLATAATSGNSGAYEVLSSYITAVEQRAAGDSAAAGTESDSGSGFPWLLLALGGAAAGGTLVYARNKRSQQRRSQAELADLRRMLDEDITAVGERIAQVEVTDPALGEAGQAQLGAAISAYNRARAVTDTMTRPTDAQAATAALDDARFALSSATELAAGRPGPQRRPPCLFDPRHGMSARDVIWTPPSTGAPQQPRPVPACEQCARALDLGGIPASRMVPSAVGAVPYWAGGPAYAPYARGYFSSYGANMLGGVLVGTMFASMLMDPAPGLGFGDATGLADGSGLDTGGGDFGGGDFGGGDFGGGF